MMENPLPAPSLESIPDEGYEMGCDVAQVPEDERKKFSDLSYKQWSQAGANMFVPTGETFPRLVPGVYRCYSSAQIGPYLERIEFNTKGILRLPDSKTNFILEEIERFWSRADIFEKYGLLQKRGILMFGPPAGGKTTTVMLVSEDVVKRGGIVLDFTSPDLVATALRFIRDIQPGTPVVVPMEDIDSIITQKFSESEVLNLLDGLEKINNVLFLATTNYPHLLGDRIINRPSRFDRRVYVGFPGPESRKLFFEHLMLAGGKFEELPEGVDLKRWVKDTEEMSLAHCKALFETVVILGNPYEEVLADLTSMNEFTPDSEDEDRLPIGLAAAVLGNQHKRRRAMKKRAAPQRIP